MGPRLIKRAMFVCETVKYYQWITTYHSKLNCMCHVQYVCVAYICLCLFQVHLEVFSFALIFSHPPKKTYTRFDILKKEVKYRLIKYWVVHVIYCNCNILSKGTQNEEPLLPTPLTISFDPKNTEIFPSRLFMHLPWDTFCVHDQQSKCANKKGWLN